MLTPGNLKEMSAAFVRFDFPSCIQRFNLNFHTGTLMMAPDKIEEVCQAMKEHLFIRYPTFEWLQIDLFSHHMHWDRMDNNKLVQWRTS